MPGGESSEGCFISWTRNISVSFGPWEYVFVLYYLRRFVKLCLHTCKGKASPYIHCSVHKEKKKRWKWDTWKYRKMQTKWRREVADGACIMISFLSFIVFDSRYCPTQHKAFFLYFSLSGINVLHPASLNSLIAFPSGSVCFDYNFWVSSLLLECSSIISFTYDMASPSPFPVLNRHSKIIYICPFPSEWYAWLVKHVTFLSIFLSIHLSIIYPFFSIFYPFSIDFLSIFYLLSIHFLSIHFLFIFYPFSIHSSIHHFSIHSSVCDP